MKEGRKKGRKEGRKAEAGRYVSSSRRDRERVQSAHGVPLVRSARYFDGGRGALHNLTRNIRLHSARASFAHTARTLNICVRHKANFTRDTRKRTRNVYTASRMHRTVKQASAYTTRGCTRGDVQCTRLRLTLARRRRRRRRWLKRGEGGRWRWARRVGRGGGAALLEEGPREAERRRRSVCSRAMNYAVRRGLRPRTSAGGG